MKKNRILYFSLFALSLFFIYFYGGKIPYMFFYTITVTSLFSALLTIIAFFRFTYVENIDKISILKGEEFNYSLQVCNEDFFLYPYVKINFCTNDIVFDKQFQTDGFSLPPFKKKTFEFSAKPKYRGEYSIGINSIEFEDYLGILKLKYKPNFAKIIKVYPQIIKLDRLDLKTIYLSEAHSVTNPKSESSHIVSDIRNYVYGDSIKRIHWKLSSKMNELLVKNFESTSKANSVIILDLMKNKHEQYQNLLIEDKLIECVVAFIYFFLNNWTNVNLIYYKDHLIQYSAKSSHQFYEIYDTLSKIQFDQDVDVKDILNMYVQNNSLKKSNILLFTSNVNYDLYDELYKSKLSGFDVNLIYVSPDNDSITYSKETDEMLKELPQIGVASYRLNTDDDIKKAFCV
ncbi:UNVERIFIED_CONTAM: uncharacterized protein (DUF58 family) [Acetivibrio alkalicellulosi]